MKPFVLLATRAESLPADEEYDLFLRMSGLSPQQLIRVRLEAGQPVPSDLDSLSGIILGGGPFNASDPDADKSAVQRRVEQNINRLLDEVVAHDFPFLGACYGIGTLGLHQGATVDRHFGEPVSVAQVSLTADGQADPLFEGVSTHFAAFVGHKEAIHRLPAHAVALASSARCPVQAFRIGRNVYATQFHPELDLAGIRTRIRAYADFGYFAAEDLEPTLTAVGAAPVHETARVLTNFVARYAR